MELPKYYELYNLLLGVIKDGQVYSISEIREQIASTLNLSEEDLAKKLPSGKQTVFNNRVAWAKSYLKKGHDVVIDCANISLRARKQYQKILSEKDNLIAVYIRSTLKQALANNQKRSRHVPAFGILFMHLRFKCPHKTEGFYRVIRVDP